MTTNYSNILGASSYELKSESMGVRIESSRSKVERDNIMRRWWGVWISRVIDNDNIIVV